MAIKPFHYPTTTVGSSTTVPVLTVDSRGVIKSVSSTSISSSGGGGGGADSAASYVVISATGSLSNERVLTAGTGISIGDGGAGGNVTISTTGAPPTGPAGGDLEGSYPNPTIGDLAVTPAKTDLTQTWNFTGTLQTGSRDVVVTTDSRLSDSRIPTGDAEGDLTGSYPNPTIGTAKITPTKTDLTQTWNFTGDLQVDGVAVVVTNDARLSDSREPIGDAGGDLSGSYPNPTLAAITTAATSGSASDVPVITIDAKGRVTSMSSVDIVIAQSAVTNLTTDISNLQTTSSNLSSSFSMLSGSFYPLSSSFVAVSSSLVAVSSSNVGKVAKTGDTMTGQLNQQYGLNFDAVDDPNVAVGAVTITTSSGGSITAGLHYYYFTYYNSIGETKVNQTFPPFSVTIASPNQTVLLSNLPTSSDSRVIGRKIYRTTANVNRWQNARLIATIADNTTTTYTDTAADGGSGNAFYRENTTNNLMTMDGARALFVGGSNVASTFLGYNAGSNNFAGTSTGGENVLIGGTANMAAGYDASKSVAIGNYSLAGESCVSIGHGAQSYSTSGAVIAIGRNSHSLCGGPGNIAIGNSSMAGGPSNHQANNNVCVGVSTGNKINAGWNNVLLGYNAGSANIVSNRSAIVIGANCDYPAGNAWAVMNIGNVLYGTNLYYSTFTVSSTPTTNGSIGICLPSPTARLHLPAGTTAASMAPLKFTSGSLLATAESGSVEFNGDKLYLTITSSTARKEIALNDGAIASGLVPYTTTNGRLTGSFIEAYPAFNFLNVSGSLNVSSSLTVTGSVTIANNRIDNAWTAYTPAWTSDGATQPALNNGTLTGYYKQIGKTVFVRVKLIIGSTTTTGDGAWLFSLPVTASSPDGIQFPCSLLDNSVAWYGGTVNGTYSGFTNRTAIITPQPSTHTQAAVSATSPFTWGSADSLQFNGSYEAA